MPGALNVHHPLTARALLQQDLVRLHAYPAMLCTGAVFGIIAATRWAELHGLAASRTFAAMLLLFFPSLLGSRLLFVAFHWELYRHQPRRILERAGGGAALYGGLILSFLVSLPLLKALAIDPMAFWDAGAIAILIGMVFTKFGCFLHGCCAGRPSEGWLAFFLPDARGVWRRRLPAQLLEAALAVLILVGSMQVADRLRFDGSLFFFSLASYGAGRWLLEPTRETIDRAGPWSLNRIISASLLAVAASAFVLLWVLRSGSAPVSH